MEHLKDNTALGRYELEVDGGVAYVEYFRRGPHTVLNHTAVPKALAGQGVGSRLAKAILEQARTNGGTVVPQCPFFAAYVERHPEYAGVVAAAG